MPETDLVRMRRVWPTRGTTLLQRAREMCAAYREAAIELSPDAVERLDAQFAEWGETWHAPVDEKEFTYEETDWLPTAVCVDRVGIPAVALGDLRATGKIPYRYLEGRDGYVYPLGEARRLRALMPGRWGGGPGRATKKPNN